MLCRPLEERTVFPTLFTKELLFLKNNKCFSTIKQILFLTPNFLIFHFFLQIPLKSQIMTSLFTCPYKVPQAPCKAMAVCRTRYYNRQSWRLNTGTQNCPHNPETGNNISSPNNPTLFYFCLENIIGFPATSPVNIVVFLLL